MTNVRVPAPGVDDALRRRVEHHRLERIGHGLEGGMDAVDAGRVTEAAAFVARLMHRLR